MRVLVFLAVLALLNQYAHAQTVSSLCTAQLLADTTLNDPAPDATCAIAMANPAYALQMMAAMTQCEINYCTCQGQPAGCITKSQCGQWTCEKNKMNCQITVADRYIGNITACNTYMSAAKAMKSNSRNCLRGACVMYGLCTDSQLSTLCPASTMLPWVGFLAMVLLALLL